MPVKNNVQLITYPDSLGGDLHSLHTVLLKYFHDVFEGGVHLLPPFPSSGDRGFAPITCLEIERSFGTWEDIRKIGSKFDVMLDLMVNHISKQSKYFQDFLKRGNNSKYADLFIPLDKMWSDGKPKTEDLKKIFLRRTEPFSTFIIEETGKQETVWTTFGKQTPSEQIDLDITSEATKELFIGFIKNFAVQKVKIVRLDAIAYVIKKPGSSCFFVEPEIYGFLSWMRNLTTVLGIEILPEVHSHYTIQRKLAEKGYWIFDFVLPFLILEALINRSSVHLTTYLQSRPHKQFTMLDCHDGIPVKPDLDGLITTSEARKIVDVCLQRGSNVSRIFSEPYKSDDGFDVHQIRCSYYSVLDCDDNAYIAARAIQFFTPGIPQVYYVGLLAGKNDIERVQRTGEGREINRHNFTLEEIDNAVQTKVVERLLKLIRFRNQHPAFDGTFSIEETGTERMTMGWKKNITQCQLHVDLKTYQTVISYTDERGMTNNYLV